MTDRPQPLGRNAFHHYETLSTRWMDVDVYGHVNNVVHYSFFDTAVNRYLVLAGALDPATSPVVGLVVDTRCSYFAELTFPQVVEAGVRVVHLGRTSVRYEIGLFAAGAATTAAVGHFVHVYVDRATRRPVPVPDRLLAALEPLRAQVPQEDAGDADPGDEDAAQPAAEESPAEEPEEPEEPEEKPVGEPGDAPG